MGEFKYFVVLSALFLASCNGSGDNSIINADVSNGYIPAIDADKLSMNEYVQWVQNPENGFKKQKSINDLLFTLQFKPYEYIVCLEEQKEHIADSTLKKKIAELNEMQYYDLKISLKEGVGELLKYRLNTAQEYTDRVNYFAFGMQKDIKMVEGNDTIPCELYHFERSFDASPNSTILLGFPVKSNSSSTEKTLLVYDKTFNTGMVKFTFSKDELKKLPKLKTL
jgi:hypothetical protein